jgi:sterol desaturase/sphingolipid hydroxylase (fatty acid hydroxylase superfamily)
MFLTVCSRKKDAPYLGPSMTAVIYFGELIFAVSVAIALLATSTFKPSTTGILFCCGILAWTLGEYIVHRFVLHAIAPVHHGTHHARPKDPIDKIFWQIWVAFVVLYVTIPGAVLAGGLVAYAWYLFVHYCAHQKPTILPASLLRHHLEHHKFANRNYGVTTKLWDRVFGTMLRRRETLRMARAIFGNKTRSSEQASVANERQPGESSPVAGKQDAQDSPSKA